jgi:hypothetical protein
MPRSLLMRRVQAKLSARMQLPVRALTGRRHLSWRPRQQGQPPGWVAQSTAGVHYLLKEWRARQRPVALPDAPAVRTALLHLLIDRRIADRLGTAATTLSLRSWVGTRSQRSAREGHTTGRSSCLDLRTARSRPRPNRGYREAPSPRGRSMIDGTARTKPHNLP